MGKESFPVSLLVFPPSQDLATVIIEKTVIISGAQVHGNRIAEVKDLNI